MFQDDTLYKLTYLLTYLLQPELPLRVHTVSFSHTFLPISTLCSVWTHNVDKWTSRRGSGWSLNLSNDSVTHRVRDDNELETFAFDFRHSKWCVLANIQLHTTAAGSKQVSN